MADGDMHTPDAEEMLGLAARENFALLSEPTTPAHVRSKAVDNAIKLAAALSSQGPIEQPAADVATVFQMLDQLPVERALELLDRKIGVVETELAELQRKRREVIEGAESASA